MALSVLSVRGRMEIWFGAGYLFASTFYVYHLTHVLQAAGLRWQPHKSIFGLLLFLPSHKDLLKPLSLRIATCVLARRRLRYVPIHSRYKYFGCKITCRNFEYNPRVEKWEKFTGAKMKK